MNVELKNNIPELRFSEFEEVSNYNKFIFDDIFLFSTGKNIKQKEASPSFEIPCVRYGELYHMYNEVISKVINKTNLDQSELLFSNGDEILLPSAGEDPLDIGSASALTLSNVAIGRTINILSPKEDNIYSQIYVSYYINQKLRKKISTLAKGVSISNVYNSDLKKLTIILPTPTEQTKIATFLTAVDKRIKLLQKKKAELEQYKKGVMQQLFSVKTDCNPSLRFKNDENDKNENYDEKKSQSIKANQKNHSTRQLRFKPARPAGGKEDGSDTSTSLSTSFPDWEVKVLGDLGEIITGKTPKTNDKSLWNGDVEFITPTDIDENSKFQSKTARTVTKNDKLKILPKDTIVYTCIASIGKMAITSKPSITNQQINSIILKNGIDFEFVYYSLLQITPRIKSLQANTTLPIINKTEFSKFTINLPSLQEQQKIATFLSSIDKSIDNMNNQIDDSVVFKKGLLQKMFC